MAARTKGSKGSKGSDDSGSSKPDLVTLKVTVPREVARLLRLEAFGRDVSLGQVVAEMVRATPRRFVLMDRAKGSVGSHALEGAAPPSVEAVEGAHGGPRAFGVVSEVA